MSTQLRERLPMTAEELAGPGVPEKFVELIEGELVEMVVRGWRCSEIAFSVAMIFHGFCKNRPDLDFASANTGVHIRKSPDTVLAPDASLFYSRPHKSEMWIEFAPEVVVEVCSPNNSRAETLLRRRLYFDAGTQQFWAVNQQERHLEFHHRDGRVLIASGDGEIECEGIATGLRFALADVFRER